MGHHHLQKQDRREFLQQSAWLSAAAGLAAAAGSGRAALQAPQLEAGEGAVDITPPLGIELAGYHYPPGKGRLITAIRQRTAARALVLRLGQAMAAIVSIDACAVSRAMADRVGAQVADKVGISAANLRLCATHSHSTPTFHPFRQWGAVSAEYLASVEKQIVRAVELARADLGPAELSLGKSHAEGANFNRTTSKWKIDKEFTKDSNDGERWLDTMVHVLRFDRAGGKRSLLWYHFCAHPVCYADGQAGPDWPGEVEKLVLDKDKLSAQYLQGHIGDVNPGPGKPWRGEAGPTGLRVYQAIRRALDAAARVKTDALRLETVRCDVPLDLDLFRQQLARYEKDPAQCVRGEWVDAAFAKDWFEGARQWDLKQSRRVITLAAMRLGSVGFLFHPSELYSYYGLRIRRDSALADTIVVGYTDDFVGYLTDPRAYEAAEYAAIVVPKIVALPPFTRTAARDLTGAAVDLLRKVAG